MERSDIEHRFKYHKPSDEKAAKHQSIRAACESLAHHINESCVDGREKSLAITHLEDTMMWANASLARNP